MINMKKIFPTYILGMSTFLLGSMAVISMYELLFLMPKYFSDPPRTFVLWKENSEMTSKIFWAPLQTGVLITLILSIIFNWKYPKRKLRLIIIISLFMLVWGVSLAYFVPKIKEFISMPPSSPMTNNLKETIETWRSLTWFRQISLIVCYIGMLVTLAIPAKSKDIIHL